MRKSRVMDEDKVREMICSALHSADVLLLHRLDGVLLVSVGRSCSEVAGWFGVNRRTVERWVHAAEERSADGLAEHPHPIGRPPKLSSAQGQATRLALLARPCVYGYPDQRWTGKRLALHLATHYGIDLSLRSCQRLISGNRGGARHPRK